MIKIIEERLKSSESQQKADFDCDNDLKEQNSEHERQVAVWRQNVQVIPAASKINHESDDSLSEKASHNSKKDSKTSQIPHEGENDAWTKKFESLYQRKKELDEELRLQMKEHERQMEILQKRLQQIREEPINDYETNTKIKECSQDQSTKRSLSEENPGNKIDHAGCSSTSQIDDDKFEKESKDREETLEEQLDRQFKDAQLGYKLINVLERKMKKFDEALKHSTNSVTKYLRNEFEKVNELRDQLTTLQIYDLEIQEKQAKCLEKVQEWIGNKCKKFPGLLAPPHNQQPVSNENSLQSHLEIPDDFKEFCIKYDVVVNMLLQPDVKDRRIVVISVDDDSFILDFCLRFMYENVSEKLN